MYDVLCLVAYFLAQLKWGYGKQTVFLINQVAIGCNLIFLNFLLEERCKLKFSNFLWSHTLLPLWIHFGSSLNIFIFKISFFSEYEIHLDLSSSKYRCNDNMLLLVHCHHMSSNIYVGMDIRDSILSDPFVIAKLPLWMSISLILMWEDSAYTSRLFLACVAKDISHKENMSLLACREKTDFVTQGV